MGFYAGTPDFSVIPVLNRLLIAGLTQAKCARESVQV
ncbi:hypothetical protein ECB171_p78 (plasmid) [Escherichia coli B171]|nr:hypothetical protein ECB171_p78 [Escherichia coli B171]